MTMKEHKLREFAKCIGYDDKKIDVDIESLIVEDSYQGPRLDKGIEELNADWVQKLIEYQRD